MTNYSPLMLEDTEALLRFYKDHLNHTLLPFWECALDEKHGGIFTCFNNTGSELVSHDKYTWSQGRFIWLWSRLAKLFQDRILPGEPAPYLKQARKTIDFLWKHAILENGHCAFLLTEQGDLKESISGTGYDTSFYADCFVILGFSEFAKVTMDIDIIERALILYENLLIRVEEDEFRSEPYPIPEGLKSHSVPMIMLNITSELYESLNQLEHPRTQEVKQVCSDFATQLLKQFRLEDGRIAEMICSDGGSEEDTVLLRHVNPGHAIEDMWFLIHAAYKFEHPEWVPLAIDSIKCALELGWDDDYGGLLRFVDKNKGKPTGKKTHDPYEHLILDTWDTKLWWPHSEALYTCLLAKRITGDRLWDQWYKKMHTYVFGIFPNPNTSIGEWIQIRDRKGNPINKVVALPVKDPFHIIRNVLLIIELLEHPTCIEGEVGHG